MPGDVTVTRLHAPAKLNLGLRVVGRRADGYHLLDTVFHAIELHDTLWLVDADELSLELVGGAGGDRVPAGDDNLVLRAARAFAAAAGLSPSGRFRLLKGVPAGGGLGGGSSDAAAALLLLQHRLGSPLGRRDLEEVAATLGADVPFFLAGGTRRGRGVGEILSETRPVPRLWFVLLVPPFGTSTAAVFKNLRAELTLAEGAATNSIDNPGSDNELWVIEEPCTRWQNDLETSAEQLYPDLARLAATIRAAGFSSLSMSGSGSTLFLSYASPADAIAAQVRLQELAPPGVRVLLTRSAHGMVASRTPSTVES
ncbi:MAG: 4-(cytidine 5'-diphospho)-2-C-methyl-D-erythritol kinase [Planctomycetota bacterium]